MVKIGKDGRFLKGNHSGNPFKKGEKWRLGKHHSEESKQKMSLSHKGKKLSEEHRRNIGKSHKGIIFTEERKKNISKAKTGRPNLLLRGRKISEEHRRKISIAHKGKKKKYKVWSYIDGRSKTKGPDRYGDDWFKIRLLIYKRDNFTCQECGITMNETRKAHHVHHKIPFLLSFDNSLNNLITLCPSCHRQEDARLIKQMKIGA